MKRTTKDGKKIDIKDMETAHIARCIARIEMSHYKWRQEYYGALLKEFKKRPGHENYILPVIHSWEVEKIRNPELF